MSIPADGSTTDCCQIIQKHSQRLSPFKIGIRNVERFVQTCEPGVELLVHFLLPLGAGRIAEEDSAAEGTNRVHRAKTSGLEGAGAGIGTVVLVGNFGQLMEERGQLEGRYVKAMAKFVKPAAPPRHDTQRPAGVDLAGDVFVELDYRRLNVGTLRGGQNPFQQ
jgi:hypothetical protein